MSDTKKTGQNTRLVVGGRHKEWTHGVVNPPVYRASTCVFETYAEMRARTAAPNEKKLFYARKGTPTQWALDDALSDLHGGAGTLLYPSGVAAIAGVFLSLLQAGDHVLITDNAYEPTRGMAGGLLKRMGIGVTYFDPLAPIRPLMTDRTRMIFTESPGSLTFEMQDIRDIVAAAQAQDALVVVDNTWATPLFHQPLAHGVDVVIEAVTKYIGGHSDLMMGSATAGERTLAALKRGAGHMGQTVSPDDAFLALRGLRSLSARLRQHEDSALKVARWLRGHEAVADVLYPALDSHPGHALWQRDFSGASGLFSIILKGGDYADTAAMTDGMRLFKMGFSWGGYESLMVPSDPTPVRTATRWSADGPLVRLHIGLEDPEDLISDLSDGLTRYGRHLNGQSGF